MGVGASIAGKEAELAAALQKSFGDDPIGPEAEASRAALVSAAETVNAADHDGASLTDVQRGIFNLLQAGASLSGVFSSFTLPDSTPATRDADAARSTRKLGDDRETAWSGGVLHS